MEHNYPDLSSVARRHADGVLHLTLNRPAVRNAMSLAMVDELLSSLRLAEADGVTRAIVLRGAQGHFCSGGDLKDMAAARAQAPTSGRDAIAAVNERFGELCLAFSQTPLAVVAVLEGSVMGGGFGLACVADVALAGSDAVFRLPETSLGLVPAQIAPFLVQRLGYSEAKRLAVTGGKLDAKEALQLRLVHEVHAGAAALEAALQAALEQIRQCAPGALAATKSLIERARREAADDLIEAAANIFARASRSAEAAEGTNAFLQKRKPAWAQ